MRDAFLVNFLFFHHLTIFFVLVLLKVFLEQLEGELESENPWERVVSLVDTQSEIVEDFKDTGRMTSILIQLKNDPLDVSETDTQYISACQILSYHVDTKPGSVCRNMCRVLDYTVSWIMVLGFGWLVH